MTDRPRIALDLDSTLAKTSDVAFDLLCGPNHDYTYEDIESWSWGFDEFGKAAYLNALWHAWTLRPGDITPTETDISQTTSQLREYAAQLDVVTAHPQDGLLGVDENKQQWLDDWDIHYDEYHSVSGDKHELEYDIYIDDSPKTAEEVAQRDDATLYLYNQPYNQDVTGDYVRVNTIYAVMGDLLVNRELA
jgi:hypothetical protein